MQQQLRRTRGRFGAVGTAGLVAAAAAPMAVLAGSDVLMVVAVFGFCLCVTVGRHQSIDDVALFGTALASAIALVCVPAAPGMMQHALALAFSCGCVSIASMTTSAGVGDATPGTA